MSRTSKATILTLSFIALAGAFGYYAAIHSSAVVSAECLASFNRLDAPSSDRELDHEEFLALGDEITMKDFVTADMDATKTLSAQEYCKWADKTDSAG